MVIVHRIPIHMSFHCTFLNKKVARRNTKLVVCARIVKVEWLASGLVSVALTQLLS